MFQIQKFKLMRLSFDWIWDLKPNFVGTYFHFLEQVSDFNALPLHEGDNPNIKILVLEFRGERFC